jgi:hypothetical protein
MTSMAEARVETVEPPREQPRFRLVTNESVKIKKALDFFQSEDMHGPEAAEKLLSLFKALPEDTTDPAKLLQPDLAGPRTLWEQVGWAYTHPDHLTSAQKDSLIPLQYYALEALAHPATSGVLGGEKRALTRTQGKAEKIFQEYDQYVASILDPDAPAWQLPRKMTAKVATGLTTAAVLLSACGPISSPTQVTLEASPTRTAQVLTPTETNTPTVTNTPTEAKTPSETPIPRPEYYEGLAPTLKEFTLIQKEDLKTVEQDIVDHPTLSEPQPLPYDSITPYNNGAFSGVLLQCTMGSNCTVRASVRVADPANGSDRWYVIWEIRNHGDNHSHVITTYIGEDLNKSMLENITEGDILFKLQKAAAKGAKTALFVPTKVIDGGRFTNPVLTEMIDHATPEQRTALDELQKTLKIPDSLSEIPVWLQSATRTN